MRRDTNIFINWEEVHSIKHALHDNPHHILGPHMTDEGVVINVYAKDALDCEIKHLDTGEVYQMRASGIDDFFTLPTDEKKIFPYSVKAIYRDGSTYEYIDAYAFEPVITNDQLAAFHEGIDYDLYKHLGAHIMKVNGVEGALFAVWAPDAQRVSVVGDFNLWDASRGLMRRLSDGEVFELFVPGIEYGSNYQFDIRTKDGRTFRKNDPCSHFNTPEPGTVSTLTDDSFSFRDGTFVKSRNKSQELPVNVYEVDLSRWRETDSDKSLYREFAGEIGDYAVKMGYTHVELMPVMNCDNKGSFGYETDGFYASDASYGTIKDLKYFIDNLHRKGIGVILDWNPYQFPRTETGLMYFDGQPLYEDSNPLRASNPDGNMIFNYGKPEVSNYLISNALYWIEECHADGLRLTNVASMLYLDYGKKDGEWLPNIYGSNENLDAVEFFKHLNSIVASRDPGVMTIAEDSSLWPDVTGDLENDGLGFTYKWNLGWSEDMLDYMSTGMADRSSKHNALTFPLIYAYNENYMYGFSHSETYFDSPLFKKMAGNGLQQAANLKALYGFLMTMPGKKYMAMGQDFGYTGSINKHPIDWSLLETDSVKASIRDFSEKLNALYRAEPALYKLDYSEEGFEWIDNLSAKDGILVYARKTEKKSDTLLVVVNFSVQSRKSYQIGVPFSGKYKEILNSDSTAFGGDGDVNSRMKQSAEKECDGRPDSISITVPAMGITIFKYGVAAKDQSVKEDKKTASKTTGTKTKTSAAKVTETKTKASAAKSSGAKAKASTAKTTGSKTKTSAVKATETKTKASAAKTTRAKTNASAGKTTVAKEKAGSDKSAAKKAPDVKTKVSAEKTAVKTTGAKAKTTADSKSADKAAANKSSSVTKK